MKKLYTLLLIGGLSIFASCKKDNSPNNGTEPNVNRIAPDGFNFSTTKNVNINVTLHANNDQPLSGIVVSIYAPDQVDSGNTLFKGVTNTAGNLTATITVPAYYSKLVIDPAYVGLLRNATATINNGSITAVIGGKQGYSGDIVADAINNVTIDTNAYNGSIRTNSSKRTDIVYPDGYSASNAFTSPTNLGRPAYLEATGDVIDASLLSYINASLPENKPLSTTHPDYLNNKVNTINITATTDVWVTFVSEGAGYQNTLAYYTYDTNNPPSQTSGGTRADGIDKITYIFPNASGAGSGGGLHSGDKVKLGTFDAGTTVAFVLLQDAWSGSGVDTKATKFYSQNAFNPESSALSQHSVVLYDDVHKLYVMGFEDQNRTDSDNDFNDLVVYATASPITAINKTNVALIDKGGDTDGDGVQDEQDAFPTDANKAYINYYPSKDTYATIAFEDNWPKKGDFDLNDMVVKYRYTFASNAKNQVVSMTGDYSVAASGASFKNGFGVQLPVSASAVQSVSGYKLSAGTYISLAGNGVESGQSKAVIIPFDNHDLMVHNPDYSFFINTLNSKDKVISQTASVVVNFVSPVDASTLKASAFNPFLISNLRRGYEIHLPGFAPTDKANSKLFGTDDDKSSASTGKYYLSAENQPWAINFTESFSYPLETININQTYLHFADWALSGGATYSDWYSNTAAGYRSTGNIYSK
ncbi:LruC domain-containing protein [Mucilaginibacter panaciglaebae]|uniref:LruC domain-containing protein n=1 Tax=Mucilaginibacter panaciglaebae TaxID=502331 RepID=A0ABP7WRU9_9SPHI